MIQRTFLRSTNTNDLRYLFWSLFVCQILSLLFTALFYSPSYSHTLWWCGKWAIPLWIHIQFWWRLLNMTMATKLRPKQKSYRDLYAEQSKKKKEHTLPNYNWMQQEKNGLDRKWACNFNLIRNTLESIDTENPSYMHTTWIVRYRVSEELRFPFHLFDSSFVYFRI